MTQNIAFELVSPEDRLVSEPVSMAILPGEEGEFGVGANHSALVAALKPGVVELYKNDEKEPFRKIFIAGGFADVTGESCTVLAEEAVNVDDLKQDSLESTLKDLMEDIAHATDEVEKKRLRRRVDMTKARISALTGRLAL
ncbi:MAG: ATP synthase F1 subunit epsilon [Alphaproteobacteria bacterium]|nr:ATP synthase F1 subunit epsilon [Alphaproteobacteria bacterium]